jgi:hypothetical protein
VFGSQHYYFMPEISKLDSTIAVGVKLDNVKSALSVLNKLTAKAEKLEAELADLKDKKAALLKDERGDDVKLSELLALRGKIDLKSAAIAHLRGEPSKGNHTAAVKSGKTVSGKAIHEHEEFHFQPSSLLQRALNLHDARRLALAFENLEKASSDLEFGIDIPPQWAE